jgi:hypothetical protein
MRTIKPGEELDQFVTSFLATLGGSTSLAGSCLCLRTSSAALVEGPGGDRKGICSASNADTRHAWFRH